MYLVHWEEDASSKREIYSRSFGRFGTALVGLEWLLTKKPWAREKINGTPLRVVTLGPFLDHQQYQVVKVFYELIDDTTVMVKFLEAWNGEDSDE